jgi:hypothetical protein
MEQCRSFFVRSVTSLTHALHKLCKLSLKWNVQSRSICKPDRLLNQIILSERRRRGYKICNKYAARQLQSIYSWDLPASALDSITLVPAILAREPYLVISADEGVLGGACVASEEGKEPGCR